MQTEATHWMNKLKKPWTSNWSLAANRACYAAVSPYKYSNGSLKFYNLHLIHCLPKVGLHTLYILNYVLFANLYREKGLKKFTEWRTNISFLTSLKTFDFFFAPVGKLQEKIPAPSPEYQMVHPLWTWITKKQLWIFVFVVQTYFYVIA